MTEKETKEKSSTGARGDAAIAWRDRYIRELGELLAGREEENRLLAAFLKCLFLKCAAKEENGEVAIEKTEIQSLAARYTATLRADDTHYRVRIEPLEVRDGGDA